MPSDIRSFFGGRGGQASSQDSRKEQPKDKKPKIRGKRKIVSDSEDDVQEQACVDQFNIRSDVNSHSARKPTQNRAPPRKPTKADSPIGEVTTTSDYFASSGKSKPARSTPTKPKAPPRKSNIGSSPSKAHPDRHTPVAKTKISSTPTRSGRTSSRKTNKPTYAISSGNEDEDDIKENLIQEDEASGDDIFGADYKSHRNGAADDYQSDDDEEEEIMPSRMMITKRKKSNATKKTNESDVEMGDLQPQKESSKLVKNVSKGHKRKSPEPENDDEDDEESFAPASKKRNGAKGKSPAKKPAAKKRKSAAIIDDLNERSEVQDIFDTIPTIRPPTPPVRDGPAKKFDFKAVAQRSQAAPSTGLTDPPIGAENCLAGLAFVFTGLLDRLGREEGIELVKRYGGKVTTGPSSKTSYVVMGNDAGPKKLETIAKLKLKVINADGLFELIRRLPANGGDGKAAEKFEAQKKQEQKKVEALAAEIEEEEKRAAKQAAAARKTADARLGQNTAEKCKPSSISRGDSRLWTVKYAPTKTNMICGNKGQVEKLQAWLRAWPENVRTNFKKPGKDGHGVFRAVMIHGPPGIGKTTAAHLAANLEGYDIVESNASDTRSKKLVETGLKGVLDTTSLLGYFSGDGKKVEISKKKLVLIMDEVDGMSAGDRGGVGALAAVCKKTSVPMILICNDRKLPKMKPFDHVTYDLPFRRPTVEQIRSRIMTICFREGMQLPIPVINAIIEGSRSDIRQIINMLSTAKLDEDVMDFDQGKAMSKQWEKNIILKPWDIVGKILGGGMFAPNSSFTLNDKIELYFNDHEFSSLMLQENYLGTSPILANQFSGKERNLKLLELVDNAAESISDGDLVDRMIHGSQQQWSLMPTHAVFSFVRPASFISGSMAGQQTRFTSWLGNNSKMSKLLRLIKEIQGHMRLRASGDRHEIRQQYLPFLWYRLIKDLEQNGKDQVDTVIDLMDSYYLTKDDWDAIMELGVGPMNMEFIKIDTQAKSAFTRIYNQKSHPLPFMKASNILAPRKSTKDKPDLEEALDNTDDDDDPTLDAADVDDDEDAPLDLKKDKYVKAPKKKVAAKKAALKSKGKAKMDEGSEEDINDDDEDEEEVKQKKRRAPAKGKSIPARSRK